MQLPNKDKQVLDSNHQPEVLNTDITPLLKHGSQKSMPDVEGRDTDLQQEVVLNGEGRKSEADIMDSQVQGTNQPGEAK